MRYDPSIGGPRWVALFDLLGTRELLASGKELAVFLAYEQAVDELRKKNQWAESIRHAWFSDTFLIIGQDASGQSCARIELLARSFAYFLICAHVPLRGAVSCERLYADFDYGIFFGRALVEAYEYGDGQDWIGLLLSPSATARLKELGLPPEERRNHAFCDVPWSRKPAAAPDRVAACILGDWISINNRNLCLDALEDMRSKAGDERVRRKYVRTIEFIKANHRMSVQDG